MSEATRVTSRCKGPAFEYIREYGDATTLHGVRYVTERNVHIVERLCWCLAIIICSVWCGIEVSKQYNRWDKLPVITTNDQKATAVTTIPMPSVTICPESKILRSVIDVSDKYDWLEAQMTQNSSSEEDLLLAQSVKLLCDYLDLDSIPFDTTKKHIDKMFEIAPHLNDIFEECKFERFTECYELFRPILTDFGICFTFNMLRDEDFFTKNYDFDNTTRFDDEVGNTEWTPETGYSKNQYNIFPLRNVEYIGPRSGLHVKLKMKATETQTKCSNENHESFRVMIQSPVDFPLPQGKHFHISPNSRSMIVVRPDILITDDALRPPKYKSEVRGCNFSEESPLHAFKFFTKQNCMLDKLVRNFAEKCKCSMHFLPMKGKDNTSLPFCSDRVYYYCDYPDLTDCIPSCFEHNYRYQVSTSQNEPDKFTKDSEYRRSKLVVYFEEATFFSMRKSEMYGLTDFLANVGGLMGLFTGFSITSVIEIIYYLSLRMFCRIRQRKSRNREVITMEDTEGNCDNESSST